MTHSDMNKSYVFFIALVSALGGLLFGYDWVVIGGAKPFYEPFFGISQKPFLQGWMVSCAYIGGILGAVVSGIAADRWGRKTPLIFAGVLFIISAMGTGYADQSAFFIIFRLIGGVAIGLASTLSPMYIAEIAPAKYRGRFVAINQLTIVIGILLAQIANWMIAEPVAGDGTAIAILNSWNGQSGWRWMFWAELIPASLFFMLMFLVPKSPRFLAKMNKDSEARRVLAKIGGAEYANDELSDIKRTLKEEIRKSGIRNQESGNQSTPMPIQRILRRSPLGLRKGIPSGNTSTNQHLNTNGKPAKIATAALLSPKVLPILTLGIVLAVFQQWCGINIIFNYAQEIFSAAGYHVGDMLFNIVITGSINLIFTLVAMKTVDNWGRRKLMLLGSIGLATVYAILGGTYYFGFSGLPVLVLVVTAIAVYAMSLAPVTWVVLSEIFPNRLRGTAMSVATLSLWIACFVLVQTFPTLNDKLGTYGIFWLYSFICVLGFLFIRKKLPETKGKSLEEIESELTH